MLKTAESTARVLAPKVQGTLALEEALGGESLRCFVLFSSISSILAPAGQIDYAAANAFLDAFAQSRQEPVTVFNWGLWNDLGMGARPRSTHSWLEQLLLNTPNEVVYAGEFSEAGRWLLSEHKLKGGKALISGTSHLEMVSSAFIRATGATAFEIRDAHFLSPAMFSANNVRQVRVQLRRETGSQPSQGFLALLCFFRALQFLSRFVPWSFSFHVPRVPRTRVPLTRILDRTRHRNHRSLSPRCTPRSSISLPSPRAAISASMSSTKTIAAARKTSSTSGLAGARCAASASATAKRWQRLSSKTNSPAT